MRQSESDLKSNLKQSLEDCNWRSVLFLSEQILKDDQNNFDALFGKAISLFSTCKLVELETWMKTLSIESMQKYYPLLGIRCKALQIRKQFSTIISFLGGDLINQLTPPILETEIVNQIPMLAEIRHNAILNLSTQTESAALPADFISHITGNKQFEFENDISGFSDPMNPKIIVNTIKVAMMNHQPKLLEKYTKISDKTSINDELLLTACGCYKYLMNEKAHAKIYLTKAIDVNPDCEIAWLSLVFIHTELSEWEQGYTKINKMSRRFPKSREISLFAISLYSKSGSIQLAWPWIKKEEINDVFYYHEKGVALFLEGQIAQARDLFQRIIIDLTNSEKSPDHLKKQTCDLIGSTYINYGHCLRRLGQFTDAIDAYQNSITFDFRQEEALASIGLTFFLLGKSDDAVVYFNQCLAINSVHPFSTKMLGTIFVSST